MLSIRQVTKDTIVFIKNHFPDLLKNLWFVTLLFVATSYGVEYFGQSKPMFHFLQLLLFSPLYVRPILTMVLHGNFKSPNLVGIQCAMRDMRFLWWTVVLYAMVLVPAGFFAWSANYTEQAFREIFQTPSFENPMYRAALLALYSNLALMLLSMIGWFYVYGRWCLSLSSFYDKKKIPFKEAWQISKGKVLKIWIASGWLYLLIHAVHRFLNPQLISDFHLQQGMRILVEVVAMIISLTASAFVYKSLVHKS